MVSLIDANVFIRFFAVDHEVLTPKARVIIGQIEQGTIKVEILPSVIMEILFVLVKLYKYDKVELIEDLKKIIGYKGVVGNKVMLVETLNSVLKYNIDFVDALICTKSKLEGYGKISFDKVVMKKCEK